MIMIVVVWLLLKIMKDSNYKEIKEDGNCPDGFEMSSFSCPKTLDWCEPIEKLNIIGNYVNAITSMCAQNCDRYYVGSYELVY